ncbi:hypothetical protein F1D05_00155 [Kribbella qitaiheensis]|uniref:Uncharacterized protein n=1 Tax=Kribbella qitaiheensis TaxID=1544730 RepID=A0A7G6WRI8_9ACTN|nr:hypothetical protein [Kribbella qitaiheensis]QNE16603.1 hypothetical protein F1D05_00155 [Kribbella qitaiheensis]
MTLRLTLSNYGSSTLEIGLVIDDDGHITGWQTSGWRVGRFARDLTAKERTELDRALESARAADAQAPPAEGPRSPSGSTEQLVADGLPDATFSSNASPPPGFEELIRVLRGVRENLADSPSAAIELEVSGTPLRARLKHIGKEPIDVRGDSELRVEALIYDKDYAVLERELHTVDAAGLDGALSDGWELELVAGLSLPTPPRGGFLSVNAGPLRVDSIGDGVLRRAEFSWVTE